ncbi:MAG: glycosyltransferase family 2 protein [Anaerolineales bacterium]
MCPVRVSVIIPNWNGWELLCPCLDSLQEQVYRDFEIIVVDNGSTDGSVSKLRKKYPWVRTLPLTENKGYSGGCNAGIRRAKGDLLVMLNNDTEVDTQWLAALVDAADRHPKAGSFASRIMIHDAPHIIHSAGDLYRRDGTSDSRGVWTEYAPPYDEESYVFGGCGAAVAYRREMLRDIGLFEEAFFMYCEDVDLSWRAQIAGWKCVYVPQAVLYHHHGASSGGALASYHVGRNSLWVIARNYPWPLLRKYWKRIISAQWGIACDALAAWRGVEARARLWGQLVGFIASIRWLGARRATQRKRRVTCSYLESILE